MDVDKALAERTVDLTKVQRADGACGSVYSETRSPGRRISLCAALNDVNDQPLSKGRLLVGDRIWKAVGGGSDTRIARNGAYSFGYCNVLPNR
jgi:hypothetical protein